MPLLAPFWMEEIPPSGNDEALYQFHRRRNTRALLHAFRTGQLNCDPIAGTVGRANGELVYIIRDSSYPRFFFQINKTRFGAFVHKAVWLFCNPQMIPEGYEINHINGDRLDSRIDNLELISRQENLNLRELCAESKRGAF